MNSQVFPTKGNLLATKKSLQLAVLGYELLDKKRNILIRELMLQVDNVKALRTQISSTFSEAYLSLQKANITLGVVQNIAETVPLENSLNIKFRHVMGIDVPIVELDEPKPLLCYDLTQTNAYFDEAYTEFQKVKKVIAMLSEVENGVYRLAHEISKTQKRANALQNVVIPRLKETEKYISDYLEEKDREEFTRMKVIKSSSKRKEQ